MFGKSFPTLRLRPPREWALCHSNAQWHPSTWKTQTHKTQFCSWRCHVTPALIPRFLPTTTSSTCQKNLNVFSSYLRVILGSGRWIQMAFVLIGCKTHICV